MPNPPETRPSPRVTAYDVCISQSYILCISRGHKQIVRDDSDEARHLQTGGGLG